MDQSRDLVPRLAESLVTEALGDTRVVTLNGARQAGKSTLARIAAREQPSAVVRLLDDPATLRAARDDPAGFDAAFARGPGLSRISPLRKRDYLDRVVRGGYPEAIRRAPRRRAAFFDSYLTNLIERDVQELAAIERRGDLRRLLALLAGRSGGLLVPATLAAASGIPRTTLNRYLELLSAVFLIKQIPAWSTSQAQRAIGTPKLAFVDTGIAAHLLGQDTTRLGEPDGAAGPMIETFVLMELARQLTWSQERARLYHYRTKDKVKVDAVLETPDGRVIAIEVKAGATVRSEDLAGLRHLSHRLGPRLVAGYVLYTGQQTLPFGDGLRAVPIDALWKTTP